MSTRKTRGCHDFWDDEDDEDERGYGRCGGYETDREDAWIGVDRDDGWPPQPAVVTGKGSQETAGKPAQESVDILQLGDELVPRSFGISKLSQKKINKVEVLIDGQNLGVRHGTLVSYAPAESAESIYPLPGGVPSVCFVQNEDGIYVAVFILLKVSMASQKQDGKSKMRLKALMVQAGELPAGDLPAGDLPAGDIPPPLFNWNMRKLLQDFTTGMWWDDVCKKCRQFVPAMPDQDAYLADLRTLCKTLGEGLSIRMNNPQPCPPLPKRPKTQQEQEAKKQQDSAGRAARSATRGQQVDIAHVQNQQEINDARAKNKLLLEKRHAEAAAAVAAAGEGLQGQGRGPAPAAAGQSSQGQGPAAAAAGDGDLPPEDQALLAQLRIYCKDPEKREVCDRARFILGSRKRNRGKQRAKPRESSGDESEAEASSQWTEDEKILPVRSKRQRKAPPQPLTMHNLVMSLNALGSCSVLNKLNKKKSVVSGTNSEAHKKKSEANGTNSKAQKKESEGGPFRITFQNKDGRLFRKLHLVSGKALWDHILPQDVHSVSCFHADIKDLNIDFDVENYCTKVAKLLKDHHVVKVLQKNNIEIPKKSKPPLSATTRSDPCPSQT